MRIAISFLFALIVTCSGFSYGAEPDAEASLTQGIEHMKAAQQKTRKGAVVDAAKAFVIARDLYKEKGDEKKVQEASTYLYWCLKSMTTDDINAYRGIVPQETVVIVEKELTEKKLPKAEAPKYFQRAEDFEKENPDEHLLVSARYWEVYDRIEYNELTMKAYGKSLGAAKELIVGMFEAEYKSDKKETQAELASVFLEEGKKGLDGPSIQSFLLLEANRLGTMGGDLETSITALDVMAEKFPFDKLGRFEMTMDYAKKNLRDDKYEKPIALGFKQLGEEAMAEGAFKLAYDSLRDAERYAKKCKDESLEGECEALQDQVKELRKEFRGLEQARDKLTKNPDDPDANLEVGKFIAFYKGNFAKGLPMLAKGSDKDIAAAAQTDLKEPTQPEAFMAVGDAYYNLAVEEDEKSAMRVGMLSRAAHYYEKAMPTLSGIAKAKVEKRIKEAGEASENLAKGQKESKSEKPKRMAEIVISATQPIRIGDNFSDNAVININRGYKYGVIPEELKGLDYIIPGHKTRPTITVKCKRSGKLYVAMSTDREALQVPSNWQLEKSIQLPGFGQETDPKVWAVYSFILEAKEEVVIPSQTRWGPNIYCVRKFSLIDEVPRVPPGAPGS